MGVSVFKIITGSAPETEAFAAELGKRLPEGAVVALFGSMGMGKTAFVRGIARGLGLDAQVTSPTFALVHDYGGRPPLYHFDMYRVESWDSLYSTGFFDYLDSGAYLAVEWSENIETVLPESRIDVTIQRHGRENERLITVKGVGAFADFSC